MSTLISQSHQNPSDLAGRVRLLAGWRPLVRGTHSHAHAQLRGAECRALLPQIAGFHCHVQLECNLTGAVACRQSGNWPLHRGRPAGRRLSAPKRSLAAHFVWSSRRLLQARRETLFPRSRHIQWEDRLYRLEQVIQLCPFSAISTVACDDRPGALQRPLVPQLDAIPDACRQRGQHERSENPRPIFWRQQDAAQDKGEP